MTPIATLLQGKCLNQETYSDDFMNLIRSGKIRTPEKIYEPLPIKESYHCEKCRDLHARFYWQYGNEYVEPCDCKQRAIVENEMRAAGVARDQTFENFHTDFDYQKKMREVAQQYAKGGYRSGQWLYIGGQVGCGKTHVCTACMKEIIKENASCYYMMWRDKAATLKGLVNQPKEYHDVLEPLLKCAVLYIDDFLKVQAGQMPTAADMNLAFQIINFRYNNPLLATIISSEFTPDKITNAIDEAVGSRIMEKSRTYHVYIGQDKEKNYRLKHLS